jgi:uncharacterized membrane protein YedE/YeeE
MLAFLKTFANDLTTTRDGVSFDVIRVGAIVTGATFVGLAIFAVVVNKQPFDPLAFGSGAAALFAGVGVGIGAKAKDEPDAS